MYEQVQNKKLIIKVLIVIIILLTTSNLNILRAEKINIKENNDELLEKQKESGKKINDSHNFLIINNTKNNNLFNSTDVKIDEIARMLLAAIIIPPSIVIGVLGFLLTAVPLIFAFLLSTIKYLITEEGADLLIAICILPFLISLTPLITSLIILSSEGEKTFFEAISSSIEFVIKEFKIVANIESLQF